MIMIKNIVITNKEHIITVNTRNKWSKQKEFMNGTNVLYSMCYTVMHLKSMALSVHRYIPQDIVQ